MVINFVTHRSKEWVAAQQLQRGTNVERSLHTTVDPETLSVSSRQILLSLGGGQYRGVDGIPHHLDGTLALGAYFPDRRIPVIIDSDHPSPEQIDAALAASWEQLAAVQVQAAAAAAERERQESELAAARLLLQEELGALQQAAEKADGDLRTLGRLLEHVPQDALRGALRAWAAEEEESHVSRLREAAEAAYPFHGYLFVNQVDDEEDEEE